MPGERVQFDDETWQAIQAVARKTGKSFQELASTALADCLNPGQTASIDSSATETCTILCGDRAETLLSVDPNPQVVSK